MRKPPFMKPCASCASVSFRAAEFPHEIGFFFGYPAEDVFAFIREKGHNYKLVGDWKVYGDGKACPAYIPQHMPDAEKDSWSKLPQVQILCLF